MSKVVPTQKYGYVDIKQASKVRPRKLKSWKHRWAVLTKMSNLSNEEYLAKLDLYDNEAKWRGNSSDKMTFVLEKVTCIQPVKSKTHKHAFEVIQEKPVLVISGATELDSYSWIVSLQQIFTPDHLQATKDSFHVTICENEDSRKWHLAGDYTLTVSATSLHLGSARGSDVVSWSLNTLMRFNVEQSPAAGHRPSLVIECGPKSTTGHSFFNLLSDQAEDILGAIRQSICLALTLKQNARMSSSPRHRSASVTTSEKSFQRLLDNQSPATHIPHSSPQPIPMARSGPSSCTSLSAFESPGRSSMLSNSPSSSLTTGHFSADLSSFLEMEENDEGHVCQSARDLTMADGTRGEIVKACGHIRSSSHPETPLMGSHDYSEIKDIMDGMRSTSRRNTISCEPADVDFDRLRSVSAVVASLQASNSHTSDTPGVSSSPQSKGDDKSDFDSAISSMALSVANEDPPRKDEPHSPVCTEGQCFCVLARRRSSSTPDLQAYWKMNRFENVYEELDELRASVQRLNQSHISDIPPELPARPHYGSSTRNAHPDTQGSASRKTSLVKLHGTHSLDQATSRTDRLCVCGNLKSARWLLNDRQCACLPLQGPRQGSKTNVIQTPSSQKLTSSLSTTINDINSIILQVQHMKRRRSSDITPVAAFFVSTISSNVNNAETSRPQPMTADLPTCRQPMTADLPTCQQPMTADLPTCRQPMTADLTTSVKSMPVTSVNLIDLQDKLDSPEPTSPTGQGQKNILDSPIQFFQDNDDLRTEAAVGGECSLQQPYNPGHLAHHGHSYPHFPVPGHLTPAERTMTWPGHITRSHNTGSCVVPVSQVHAVDIWAMEATDRSVPRGRLDTSVQDSTPPPFFLF